MSNTQIFHININDIRSGELQNLWYHMDKNKITRQGFRRILVEATDNLPVTFPASPCPYPAGPIGPASDISYTGDTTPKGGVSVTGARLQRVLNRAAYEDNVRHGAAGSAMTRALQGEEEGGENKCVRVVRFGRGGGGAHVPVYLSDINFYSAK